MWKSKQTWIKDQMGNGLAERMDQSLEQKVSSQNSTITTDRQLRKNTGQLLHGKGSDLQGRALVVMVNNGIVSLSDA